MEVITLKRTTGTNPDFQKLVTELDAYMQTIDKEEFEFFNQYNNSTPLECVVLAYNDSEVLGCGAIKKYNKTTAEVKRMFVLPKARGKSIAMQILQQLEIWAAEINCHTMLLETAIELKPAHKLYKKAGYKLVPNFGQYIGIKRSICFLKNL
jgi:GNAT superfamily N-acetyltransferase